MDRHQPKGTYRNMEQGESRAQWRHHPTDKNDESLEQDQWCFANLVPSRVSFAPDFEGGVNHGFPFGSSVCVWQGETLFSLPCSIHCTRPCCIRLTCGGILKHSKEERGCHKPIGNSVYES